MYVVWAEYLHTFIIIVIMDDPLVLQNFWEFAQIAFFQSDSWWFRMRKCLGLPPPASKKGGGAKRMQDFPMQVKQFSKSGLLFLATAPSSPHQADHCLINFLGKWRTHTVKSWDFLNDYSFKILLNLLCLNGVCQLLSWVCSMSLLVWAERAWANSFWTQ